MRLSIARQSSTPWTLRSGTFSCLGEADFRTYFAGNAVSFLGTWMSQATAYWLAYDLGGSPAALGALALAQLLPVTVFGLVGGAIADRSDLRRLIIACEVLLAAAAGVLALLALSDALTLWVLWVIGGVQGTGIALVGPARNSLVFELVGHARLQSAIGLMAAAGTVAKAVGPALGGLVVTSVGPAPVFAWNAISYLVSISSILAIKKIAPRARSGASLKTGLAEMMSVVVRERAIRFTFVSVMVVAVAASSFDVLIPLLAGTTLTGGAGVFGLLASVFGAGALAGSLATAAVRLAPRSAAAAGALGLGSAHIALAGQNEVWTVGACLFVVGGCFAVWSATSLVTLQLDAPPHMRGRAAALYSFGAYGCAPFGAIVASCLAAVGGTSLAFLVAGISGLAVGAVGLLRGRKTAERR